MIKYRVILFLLLLIFGSFFFFLFNYLQSNRVNSIENFKSFLVNNYGNSLSVFARNLVDPILLNEKEVISEVISDLNKIDGIVYVAVVDKDENLIASSRVTDEGKKVGEVLGKEVNLGLSSQLEIANELGAFYLITPVKLKTGDLERVIGGLLIGFSSRVIEDIFFVQELTNALVIFLPVLFLSSLLIFVLAQIFIFGPISRKLKNYELREKRYVTYDELKRKEEGLKVSISQLEEKKRNIEVEIEEVSKVLENKRKEIEESELGKIVKELEERKVTLENEIEKLKKEREEVEAKLIKQKMEQEELKKRLDIIREKMRQIMGP